MHSCPNCGYCPHCGRREAAPTPWVYPVRPRPSGPFWIAPRHPGNQWINRWQTTTVNR